MQALWGEGFSSFRSNGTNKSKKSNESAASVPAPAAAPAYAASESERAAGIVPLEQLQTLAVHLHRQTAARAEWHGKLQAGLDEEQARNAAVRAEIDALRAEIKQHQGLLSGALEGGEAMRATKKLIEEQERREALNQQVETLKEKMNTIGGAVKQLVSKRHEPSADEVIDDDTTGALSQLGMFREMANAGSPEPAATATAG